MRGFYVYHKNAWNYLSDILFIKYYKMLGMPKVFYKIAFKPRSVSSGAVLNVLGIIYLLNVTEKRRSR